MGCTDYVASHYLYHLWLRPFTSCGVTSPQWVNFRMNQTWCNSDIAFNFKGNIMDTTTAIKRKLIDYQLMYHIFRRTVLVWWSISSRLNIMCMETIATNSNHTTTSHVPSGINHQYFPVCMLLTIYMSMIVLFVNDFIQASTHSHFF